MSYFFGNIELACSITFSVPPLITQINGPSAVDTAETFTLICVVSGIPLPEVTWLLDDAAVRASLNGRITFPSYNSLKVRDRYKGRFFNVDFL